MGALVDSLHAHQKIQTPMPGTNCIAGGPSSPLPMEILDALTVHAKMSLIHSIATHVIKLVQTKSTLALAPALVETYSRLLVYTEIESLGIKGFIGKFNQYCLMMWLFHRRITGHPRWTLCLKETALPRVIYYVMEDFLLFSYLNAEDTHSPHLTGQLLPTVFKCQCWGIMHTLLEMFSHRLHHIQPHYRVQLLSHLHSLSTVPQTNHTQLHLWWVETSCYFVIQEWGIIVLPTSECLLMSKFALAKLLDAFIKRCKVS